MELNRDTNIEYIKKKQTDIVVNRTLCSLIQVAKKMEFGCKICQ